MTWPRGINCSGAIGSSTFATLSAIANGCDIARSEPNRGFLVIAPHRRFEAVRPAWATPEVENPLAIAWRRHHPDRMSETVASRTGRRSVGLTAGSTRPTNV